MARQLAIPELRRGLARQIAREARELLSEERGLWFGPKGQTKRIEPGDIFVLTATNKDAREVSRALREAGVPFAFYKQDGLFQTDEARDVRDLLAAIDDPADPAERGRAWITPFFAVPLAALPDLVDLPDSHPLVKRLTDWNELAGRRRFESLFTRILDDSGVIRRELFLKDDERALTNYLHIFEILLEDARAAGCDAGRSGRDAHCLHPGNAQAPRRRRQRSAPRKRPQGRPDHDHPQEQGPGGGRRLSLRWVHARFRSDGLHEYHEDQQRVLYLGDDEDAKKEAKEEREREEQRLYYVALTRAKARLYLPLVPAELWSKRWNGGYGRVNERLLVVESGLKGTANEHLFKVVPFQDRPIGDEADDPARSGSRPRLVAAAGQRSWRIAIARGSSPVSGDSTPATRFRRIRG